MTYWPRSLNCLAAWDPKSLSSEQLFKVLYLIQIASLVEEETQVRGVVIIIDFHGLSTKQVMAMSPSFAMTLLLYIQVSAFEKNKLYLFHGKQTMPQIWAHRGVGTSKSIVLSPPISKSTTSRPQNKKSLNNICNSNYIVELKRRVLATVFGLDNNVLSLTYYFRFYLSVYE